MYIKELEMKDREEVMERLVRWVVDTKVDKQQIEENRVQQLVNTYKAKLGAMLFELE